MEGPRVVRDATGGRMARTVLLPHVLYAQYLVQVKRIKSQLTWSLHHAADRCQLPCYTEKCMRRMKFTSEQ